MQSNRKILILLGAALLGVLIIFGAPVGAIAANRSEFDKYDSLFQKYGAIYQVPWRWLKAICIVESDLGRDKRVKIGLQNPFDYEGSKSSDGLSWGIMQVTLKTAKALAGESVSIADLNNPEVSVKLAAQLMRENINRFGIEARESIVRAYNGGPKFGAATLPYLAKFEAAILVVLTKNPGKELDYV